MHTKKPGAKAMIRVGHVKPQAAASVGHVGHRWGKGKVARYPERYRDNTVTYSIYNFSIIQYNTIYSYWKHRTSSVSFSMAMVNYQTVDHSKLRSMDVGLWHGGSISNICKCWGTCQILGATIWNEPMRTLLLAGWVRMLWLVILRPLPAIKSHDINNMPI